MNSQSLQTITAREQLGNHPNTGFVLRAQGLKQILWAESQQMKSAQAASLIFLWRFDKVLGVQHSSEAAPLAETHMLPWFQPQAVFGNGRIFPFCPDPPSVSCPSYLSLCSQCCGLGRGSISAWGPRLMFCWGLSTFWLSLPLDRLSKLV